MNPMLDGDAVLEGDLIHDLFLGTGRVVQAASDGSFTAVFGQRMLRYAAGGRVSEVKRVFWRDPVLVTPRKNEGARWALYQRLIEAAKG